MTHGENGEYAARVGIGILFFFFLSSISALSQTPCQPTGSGVCRYVSATGSDSNNGLTRTTPKQTIQTTINASLPGDEIIVLAGTYNCANQPGVSSASCVGGENSGTVLVNETTSGTAANPIVLICDVYLACRLDGNNNNTAEAIEVGGNYITIRNFEVAGFADDGLSNWRGGSNTIFARNWVHDNGRYCTTTLYGRDGIFVYHSNTIITQNIISDIGRYASGENGCINAGPQQHDHCIYADGAQSPTNLTITNNIFIRCNRGWGVHLYPGTWNGTVSILNNTFIWGMPSASYGQILVYANVSNLLIENNVGYQPNYSFIYNYAGNTVTGTYANNIIYGTSLVMDSLPSGYNITVTGNLVNTDPKLASVGSSIMDNPSVPDAHLTSGSPAIKAGLTLAAVPDDFDGTARIPGAYDIGSYAFQLTSTVSPPINLQVVVH